MTDPSALLSTLSSQVEAGDLAGGRKTLASLKLALLDAPADVGMGRAEKRGAADRLEIEQASFYSRVRTGYLALAAAEPERFAIIDASLELAAVQVQISAAIARLLDE